MVGGLAILCVALYHIIAPGSKKIAGRTKWLLRPFFLYSVSFWAVGSIALVLKGEVTVTEALCCLRNFFAGNVSGRHCIHHIKRKKCKSVRLIIISTAVMLLVTGGLRGASISLPYNLQLIPF